MQTIISLQSKTHCGFKSANPHNTPVSNTKSMLYKTKENLCHVFNITIYHYILSIDVFDILKKDLLPFKIEVLIQ